MTTRNLFVCILAMAPFFANAVSKDKDDKKTVDVGSPVYSGDLFYDGRYVEPPYTFKRQGFSIYVNDHKIYFPSDEIKYLLPNRDDNVDIKSIPKDISFEEFCDPEKPWGTFMSREIVKIHKLYKDRESKIHIMEFYKKLPFVKSVKEHERDGIIVETYKGDKTNIDTESTFDSDEDVDYKIPTKEDVYRMLETNYIGRICDELRNGYCVFIFSDTEDRLSLNEDEVRNNLPEIIEVLKSEQSKELKINKLYRLRLFPERDFAKSGTIVDNFKDSPQLQEKIASIIAWRKDNNYTRKEVEKEPTPEELFKAMEKADNEAFEKHQEEQREKKEKLKAQ